MQEKRNSKKVLGLVITDGVGYRNFCLSQFLIEAVKKFDKIIIYSGLPSSIYDTTDFEQVEVVELPVFKEAFHTWFWRKIKEVAHLQLHKNNFGINDNLKAGKSKVNSNRGTATRVIYGITKYFYSEKNIKFYEKRHFNSLRNLKITEFCLQKLKTTKPDLLFFTHQRPPYVVPLVVAADKLKIRTGSFIFSWDNLASKGRMAGKFKFYLVWSELMKEELLHFYPSTNQDKIFVVGTPQFEPYVITKYQNKKEIFHLTFGLNPLKKTICFSCGDVSTSPNDPFYIECIAQAIERSKLKEDVNFLVRTSPAEEPARFQYLIDKFPIIKWNFPKWVLAREGHPEPWSQRVPTESDIKELLMILQFSDVGINMCSTMSLDFMLFDKPVINPVFGNEKNDLYNDQRFLEFEHYRNVVSSRAVAIADNEEKLIKEINFSLDNPEARIKEQKSVLNMQIGKPLVGTSQRIVNALLDLATS